MEILRVKVIAANYGVDSRTLKKRLLKIPYFKVLYAQAEQSNEIIQSFTPLQVIEIEKYLGPMHEKVTQTQTQQYNPTHPKTSL